MKKFLLLLAMPFLAFTCHDDEIYWEDDIKTMTLTVGSHGGTSNLDPFDGVHSVLFVKFDGALTWEKLNGIQGFEYEEGYEYVLKVERRRYDPAIQDVGRYYYIFKEIISKIEKETEGLPVDMWGEYVTIGSKMTRIISPAGDEVDAYYIKFRSRSQHPEWEKIETLSLPKFREYEEGYEYELYVYVEKLWDKEDGVYHMRYVLTYVLEKNKKNSTGLPQ